MHPKRLVAGILIVTTLVLSGVFRFGSRPSPAEAVALNWQKGASILPRWDTDFESNSFKQSVSNLAATGANTVTLVIPLYTWDIHSPEVRQDRERNTPTDGSLGSAIDYIHSLGLKVSLKPHLESYDGKWRAFINPDDRQAWFSAYGAMLRHYGKIAERHKAEQFVIGTELISMTDDSVHPMNTFHWKEMIIDLRNIYGGKLTYSANWGGTDFYDEKNDIGFWDDLDMIGISAYFFLNDDDRYTLEEIRDRWAFWNSTQIRPLHERYKKPILFTEVGYRSVDGALRSPPGWQNDGPSDEQEQADAYEALLSYWSTQPFMVGVDFWDWKSDPSGGEPGNNHFTPQNKLAQQVMSNWFGQDKEAKKGISFSGRVSIAPRAPKANRQSIFTVQVKNLGDKIYGTLVDLEIYDAQGNKIFQQIFENQFFDSGQSRSFSATWVPTIGGKYKVKLGLFNHDWTKAYYWKNDALNLNIPVVR